MLTSWKVAVPKYRTEWQGHLEAVWEVELSSMSDNYTPSEISAVELLGKWAKQAHEKFPDGLIPIHWYVLSRDGGKFEPMPFQYDHFRGEGLGDFLTHYDWPVDAETGDPSNACFPA